MNDKLLLAVIDADRRRLVRAATRLLGSAEAEDAVQDAYVRALEADTLQLASAQAWLLIVLRRLAVDRLRRRKWIQRWSAEVSAGSAQLASPSAETNAAQMEEARKALLLLAVHLTPEDGATVLLHEVFEAGYAEIAGASGRTEAGCRQQLRRVLLRLRNAGCTPGPRRHPGLEPREEVVFRIYLQSLQLRDPRALWAVLRQPPIIASRATSEVAADTASAPPATGCAVLQVGGQLGMVLTLDGVTLCVLPLGVRTERSATTLL